MLNKNIIKWFKLLIIHLKSKINTLHGKEKIIYSYKLNSFQKSIEVIKNIKFNIKYGLQIKEYKNIGSGTIKRIDEILKTNKLSEINSNIIGYESIKSFMKIFGIGKKKSYELYEKYNIKDIKSLKEAIKKKEIILPENIIKGIKYLNKIKKNISREEIYKIYLFLKKVAAKRNIIVKICGSYRRKRKKINDIDVIITNTEIKKKCNLNNNYIFKNFIYDLINKNFIVESLTSENVKTKYMGICQLKSNYKLRRIDIRFIPLESYYTALLYFTGSKEFNKTLRRVALNINYKLNEYYLYNENKVPFKINSEKKIFELLNMEYIEPKNRNL